MPELPEVEVVRSGIEAAVSGARIAAVEVFEPRSLRRHDLVAGAFTDLLQGARTLAAVRRGKFLWLPLQSAAGAEPARALVVHLGMSGQVLLRTPGYDADRLLRIRLSLEHPVHGELWLNFVDQRIFGSMAVDHLVPVADGAAAGYSGLAPSDETWSALIPSQVAHIARDPLDPAFVPQTFFAALARKKTDIKRALLDQTLISGIGNIYADEALFAAQLNYRQPANSLTKKQRELLLGSVQVILNRALAEGGTSFDAQYVNVNGQSGYFSHSLEAYGQQGKPCSRCGTTLVREQFMNRSSHLCPRCQRLRVPRPAPAQTPLP
jgi:formamidopyrimidine-DNA glycosylase